MVRTKVTYVGTLAACGGGTTPGARTASAQGLTFVLRAVHGGSGLLVVQLRSQLHQAGHPV